MFNSSGTAESRFRIQPYGGAYTIFAESQWAQVSNTSRDSSPGFYFVNKTDWPIAYSLDQVGCLYYGIVPKGGVIKRKTGAVWFTLRMHIQPDGVNPQTDWDCIRPVAEIVAQIGLDVMTGGASGPAAAALSVVVKDAVKEGLKVAAQEIGKNLVKQALSDMVEKEQVSMEGQYAGYDWPFQCREMPEYQITGGVSGDQRCLREHFPGSRGAVDSYKGQQLRQRPNVLES